ncbi:hypothetical protein MUK70_19205 [Dyadobacter chenwenxiniae]|uniref:Uncharacterized protein n=1 Tax=Dyadobacter chenwenxiniae TaxID=2906456 RepID=A0A9X1PJ86_9BACT|nr:hypothetical protein [Dyadobacter chenwenxiniae]MCF0061370.1 hypothetical protein [Dyadobacter chenwenxiniae]UON81192.1 hypothetical protein MUK70_19205 [Dyadobacter chenwenxiniae]
MLAAQNKIIIVDNMQDELDRLGRSFFNNGLGCRTFLYTVDYDDEPLKNVRLAFFDINLISGREVLTDQDIQDILENHTTVLNDIAYAIGQFIHVDNGPYALIFWTKNSALIGAIRDYIGNEERGYGDLPSPIFIGCLDKTEFDDDDKIVHLSERVLELINSNEKLKFLFDLENNAKIAGEKTLNRLASIIPREDSWGISTRFFDNLDMVLSRVAASTLGFEHSKSNPQRAVYEGLVPIVNYEFLNSSSDVDWREITSQLTNAKAISNLANPSDIIQHKMNALYHIEACQDNVKAVRGCVLEIDRFNEAHMKSLNIEDVDEWITKLLAIKDGSDAQKARKIEILGQSKIVAIEISAACDYANKKPRINKYILGVLTSNLNFKLDSDLNLKNRPESCYHLGGCCFHANNKDLHIWLNLNYVFGALSTDERLGNSVFILKKEIMDMLGNKYASHVSRIGITSL